MPHALTNWALGHPVNPLTARGVAVDKTVPPDDVRRVFGLACGVPMLQRSRRYTDAAGETVQLATSFLPLEAIGQWAWRTDTGPGGVYARLADMGLEPVRFREELRTRLPSEKEEAAFGSPGPVAAITRTAYSADEEPVEVARLVLAGHRHVLSYSFTV
ncbi:UTRA domain-containing protein [Nocardiopsis sp. RSe5-2]|uniref:UTRA domain-containing protein n=1 Tax=Nocardiopsis endophytica TaxID=3018445 RepID=A0ABT4U7T6_9ACTN|nr:UTRA domain-containing protein [Nocardiopsis endophytica]MDA2813023.1 UTRA domain-containing protein [Nocardiopsis endophytica]